MFGIFPLLLVALVALLFGAFYAWARREGIVAASPPGEEVAGQRRISLVTEALAYVGAILVLAGGGAAVAQRWDDLGAWGHVSVFAGTAAFFLVVGVLLIGVHDAAVQRLVGVLWFLSSVGVGVAAGIAAYEVFEVAGEMVPLWIGVATAVYSGGLWLVRRRALQNAALFGGLVVTVSGVIAAVDTDPPAVVPALALWSLGVAWALLGWRRYVEPLWVSLPLGVLLALVAPAVAVYDYGWMYAIAIATAAAVMTLSVPLHNTPLLGVGAVGMFGYVTATVVRYFGDTLGVPAALAITGVVILVLAVVTARLARLTRSAPPDEPDHKPTPPVEHELPKAS